MDAAPPILAQTPPAIHQQAADDIADSLKQVLEGDHQVMPVNEDTVVEIGDSLNQKVDRVIFNRPGQEPSKSFLAKLKERIGKKSN